MSSLLLSDNFPPKTGGSGRWFWEIYRRLPRDQFLIAAGENHRQTDFDTSHDLRIFRLPLTLPQWGIASWSGMVGYWKAVRRLKKVVCSHNVGIIHCGRVLPEGVMALAIKAWLGIPYLCYVHGEDVTTARESREYTYLVHRVLCGAQKLIANSANTKKILCGDWNVPSQRVQVLHPGVDTGRFVPAPVNSSTRKALDWGGRTVVLTVGRLQERKGHDQMIRATKLLLDAFPDLLYAIVGEGERRGVLEEIVRAEGLQNHVQFMGEPDDSRLVECYQQCDLFILPNRQVGKDIEGFGMVLLEAQACGKPVFAGASGGTSETMSIGTTGFVIDCKSPDSIAREVGPLLQNRERMAAMGLAARDWVTSRFDWGSLASQAAELFGTVLPSERKLAVAAC